MNHSEQQFILEFYIRSDAFLTTQIQCALGKVSTEVVKNEHQALLNFLRSGTWQGSFREAVERHVEEVAGAAVSILGFPQFGGLDKIANVEESLERERSLFKSLPFSLDALDLPYASLFDPVTNDTPLGRQEWLQINNVVLEKPPTPRALVGKLFEWDGVDPKSLCVELFEAPNREFFMARLHSERKCLVGHGRIETLFDASTFAHEIGHTTTPQERDLWKKFHLKTSDPAGVHDELDSYRYEKIFMEHLSVLIGADEEDDKVYREILRSRKALQYNYHLLGCYLSYLFFKGTNLKQIKEDFLEIMEGFFKPLNVEGKAWWEFASLARPLSKLGFVQAFRSVFGDPVQNSNSSFLLDT